MLCKGQSGLLCATQFLKVNLAHIFLFQILLAWIVAALVILAHCAGEIKATTLTDVLHTACGKPGRVACSLTTALYCFGTCVTFLIIIGDQFDRGTF